MNPICKIKGHKRARIIEYGKTYIEETHYCARCLKVFKRTLTKNKRIEEAKA